LAKQSKSKELSTKQIYFQRPLDYNSHEFSSLFDGCPVSACRVTRTATPKLDAYLFREIISFPREYNPERQNEIWIYYSLESPNTYTLDDGVNCINWTATYRFDSDIVTPYAKFVAFNNSVSTTTKVNYAKGKTKKVAWFVSNCNSNNNRLQYAQELNKYIEVDIYGICGTKRCSRSNGNHCFDMLKRDYKFYLSFENSNCRDYITEKFFANALDNNVLPIVMGAYAEDYDRVAPPHSFIHVDEFESAESLAKYLHKLDKNDELYNSYFDWKGSGQFINTRFWCRLCALLHSKSKRRHYKDLATWWQRNICNNDGHLQ
ncbi:glycoprotein 3-alpha-L-fucosyltransferase A-like protein, partial [Leptotrombidium deliense]